MVCYHVRNTSEEECDLRIASSAVLVVTIALWSLTFDHPVIQLNKEIVTCDLSGAFPCFVNHHYNSLQHNFSFNKARTVLAS